MKIYVGTSGFGYKEWKGKFYPERISARDMLRFYSTHLNTVEINNTFYRMPTEKVLTSWSDQVPRGFVFAIKAPQVITHMKRLKHVEDEAGFFFTSLSALGNKLGPVLFQFPKSFRVDSSALKNFLNVVPDSILCAFEFRSPSWLEGDTLDLLREKGCALCISDSDENPTHKIISTASWGYLRLRRSSYDNADLSQWMARISAQKKWKNTFVFFKHEDDAAGPDMAMRFRELTGRSGKERKRA